MCRFSDGYTLQLKVKTSSYNESPIAEGAVPSPPPPYTAEAGMPPQDLDIINRVKGYVHQSYYGSVLLEEHQVYTIVTVYFMNAVLYTRTSSASLLAV